MLKIFINEVFSGATDWLSALRSCIAEGGTLAKVESAAENSVVQVRVGRTEAPRVDFVNAVSLQGLIGSDVSWLGLQDFVTEGSFAWADSAALGSFTNWLANQPDNGAAAAAAAQGNQVGIRVVCQHVARDTCTLYLCSTAR